MRFVETLHAAALVSTLLLAGAASSSAGGQDTPAGVILPAPTGPFSVGRTIYEWTDEARDEMLSEVEGERRSVVVWVWYPAEASAGPASHYMPGALGEMLEENIGLPSRLVQVASRDDVPVVIGGSLPVLVFSHGSGSLLAVYSSMLIELASHGYVVVGIQHPYNAMLTTFTDGRVIPTSPNASQDTVQYWSEDTAFVVDELQRLSSEAGMFARRLDLSRLGVFGHSYGGAAAAEFCLDDVRCVAGLNFDGSYSGDVEAAGVRQPFMQVLSETSCEDVVARGEMPSLEECLTVLERYEAGWQRMFDTSTAAYRLTVAGSKHGSFSDVPFLLPLVPNFAEGATIAPERAWEIATRLALAFFDRHLGGGEGPFPEFPEVTLEVENRR